jgi:hypothetical protein
LYYRDQITNYLKYLKNLQATMSGPTSKPDDSQTTVSKIDPLQIKQPETTPVPGTIVKRSADDVVDKIPGEQVSDKSDNSDTGSNIKRRRPNEHGTKQPSSNIFDGAFVYGLKPGDRVSVKWEIIENEGTDDEKAVDHWWGATLLEYDGRTYIEQEDDEDEKQQQLNDTDDDAGPVAVHLLEYDEYPEGGFPEKSREEVIFASAFELVDLKSMDTLPYKRIGDDNMIEVIGNENGGFEEMVNTVLANAMKKSSGNFNSLPASVQLNIAEKIAEKKAKLVKLMEEFFASSGKRVGTTEDMKNLIQQTMQD